MAPIPSSGSHLKGRGLCEEMGCARHLYWPFLRSLAPVVPLVAGIFAMPNWPFQFANFASAFVWAAVVLQLGSLGSDFLR